MFATQAQIIITMARILETGSLKRDNLLEMSTEAPKINDLGTTMKLGVYGEKDIMTQVKVLLVKWPRNISWRDERLLELRFFLVR